MENTVVSVLKQISLGILSTNERGFLATNTKVITRKIRYNSPWFVKPIFDIKLREMRFCELWIYPIPAHREFFTLSSKARKAWSPIYQLAGRFSSLQATLLFYVPFHSSLFMPLCHVFSQFLGVDSFSFFRIPPPSLLSSQSLISLLFRLSVIFLFPYLTSTR